MRISKRLLALTLLLTPMLGAQAQSSREPLIAGFGPVLPVTQTTPISADSTFKVAYDVTATGERGALNRSFDSVARFLNMHASVGVAAENMQLAVVVHGKAVNDVLREENYNEMFAAASPNAQLLRELMANNVRIIVCGQSAAFAGIEAKQLLPGVEIALSAMTAHALLQQDGYTLNPF